MTEEGRKSRLKKEKVRFRNTTSLPNHDYYFNDENDVYVYLVLFTPALMFSYGQDNSCKWTSLSALSLCGVTVCVL